MLHRAVDRNTVSVRKTSGRPCHRHVPQRAMGDSGPPTPCLPLESGRLDSGKEFEKKGRQEFKEGFKQKHNEGQEQGNDSPLLDLGTWQNIVKIRLD